jgi:predicted Co/Zn/Cd cation transporter (cation efflux family)
MHHHGDVASQVDHGVQLHRALVVVEPRPGEQRQAQVDGGGVQRVGGAVEIGAERVLCMEPARNSDQGRGEAGIELDSVSWLMSAALSAALLVAFGLAIMVEGTAFAWAARYADSAVLAVLSAALAVLPIGMLREAWRDIFQMAPEPLDEQVRGIMAAFIERHGLVTWSSYVARVGRARFIEVHVVLPEDFPLGSVAVLDDMRREIADAIGAAGPDRWLTVAFTGDPRLT